MHSKTSLFAATAICIGLCAPSADAQTVPFPMATTSTDVGVVRLSPDRGALQGLASLERVTMTGVPLPAGGTTTLRLTRVGLHLAPGAIRVDGVPQSTWTESGLSLWSGRVVGQSDSQAFLAFSSHGSRGWFGRPGEFKHLLAEPGAGDDWSTSTSRLVTEAWVAQAGPARPMTCNVITPPGTVPTEPPQQTVISSAPPLPYYDAPIAFETDYEFYQLFNNLPAAQAYAAALFGAISDRYREQNGVIFTMPYLGFYTQNNDPWTDTGCSGRLNQFRRAWDNGAAPVTAGLYHMVSGVPVSGCGGVAYLDVLCNQNYGFGMSAHINSNLTFPPVQGPLTWDFMVIAHELGHNFGAPHTHDYSPQIDNCAGGDCSVVPNGTIMSYCHTCSGGMRNINLMFHPRVATTIRTAVLASCLQEFNGIITADAGNALVGSNGTPEQEVSYADPRVTIDVANAPSTQPGVLFLGFSEVNQAFVGGGILVPSPDVGLPMPTDASGDASFSFPVFASFPGGATVWMQSWFLDPAGPNQWAASNATRMELIRP